MALCQTQCLLLISVVLAVTVPFSHGNDIFGVSDKPPHILFVLVDDLGWSDVGFHGSKIHTPNIDRLASEGVILDNYYVQPVCSPTRSSLMSGRYPIHTGFQYGGLAISSPFGLPLNFTIFPEKLKEAGIGYSTHMVGKWHLGFYQWEYTPTYRGFDTFYGYYNGAEDHYTHEKEDILDLRDNKEPVRDMNGTYSVHMLMKQVHKIVSGHDPSKPLFLYVAFQNVHAPVQAPQRYIDKYSFIEDTTRRVYAAMADIMDEAVGNITQLFRENGLREDTLMVLSADNGGRPAHGGYNWPLRGQKKTLWEGGVRAAGLVHGNKLMRRGVKCQELIHVTDWYPTLLTLAGVKRVGGSTPPLDGFNVWNSISHGEQSPRREIIHNIDMKPRKKPLDHQGIAIRVGDMKLLMNVPNQTWFVPPEQGGGLSSEIDENEKGNTIIQLALYNITADPEERTDLSAKFPDIVRKLQDRVEFFKKGMVPGLDGPHDPEARKEAEKDKVWSPWRDSTNLSY